MTARACFETVTGAELEVLRLVASGRTIRQAASARGVTVNTTQAQLYSVYRKLNLAHRGEFMIWAISHGFGGQR